MADYSIDDILAELDAKKSGSSDNTGRSYGDDTPPRHHDISATAIIEGLDGSEDGVYLREKDGDTENVDAEYINEAQDGSDEVSIATSYESRKDNGSTDNSDIDKITGEQSDVDKVLGETDNFMIADASSEIDIDEHKAKVLADNEKTVQAKPAEAEKAPEPVHEIRKEIVSDEEKRRMMLEKERENSDPDDMLALVNPLEVKEKVNEQVKEKELVSVAELRQTHPDRVGKRSRQRKNRSRTSYYCSVPGYRPVRRRKYQSLYIRRDIVKPLLSVSDLRRFLR